GLAPVDPVETFGRALIAFALLGSRLLAKRDAVAPDGLAAADQMQLPFGFGDQHLVDQRSLEGWGGAGMGHAREHQAENGKQPAHWDSLDHDCIRPVCIGSLKAPYMKRAGKVCRTRSWSRILGEVSSPEKRGLTDRIRE